jgi:uncharacterized protein YpmS
MKMTHMRYILVILALGLAAMACNLPARSGPVRPTFEPTLPREDVQALEESLKATLAANANTSEEVTITITQQELNSYMLQELDAQGDMPISDPQLVLTNGQVELYGKVSQSGFALDSKIIMTPRVTEAGDPKLDVVSINVGPFPAPDSLKNQVTSMVDDTVRDYVAAQGTDYTVRNITVTEGVMTVVGVPKS